MVNAARARGFTLVELLVVLAVLGVLAVVATPSMTRLMATQRVRSMAGDLQLALVQARSEALKRNASVTLSPTGGDWTGGWAVIAPEDPDGVPLRVYGPANGVQVTASVPRVVYAGSGRTTLAAEASFLVNAPGTDEARCIRVNLAGRPSVQEGAAC